MKKTLFVRHAPRSNELAFLRNFAVTAVRHCGWSIVDEPEEAQVSVVWGFDRLVQGQPTLFVECGWLPRWEYQVSWKGINRKSHAKVLDGNSLPALGKLEQEDVSTELLRLQRAISPDFPGLYAYANPSGPATTLPPRIREHFLVCLQVEEDPNREGSSYRSMQQFVNFLEEKQEAFDLASFVFRPHPALVARNQTLELSNPEKNWVVNPVNSTVHQNLRHPWCQGVITLNSNCVHDALIWGKLSLALEPGVWPTINSPIANSEEELYNRIQGAQGNPKREQDLVLRYVAHLRRQQWKLDDSLFPQRVGQILDRCLAEPTEEGALN